MKIKKINIFIKELKAFGIYIAITNLLWPYIVKMPHSIALEIMKRKHQMVFKYLKDICLRNENYSSNTETSNKVSFLSEPIWVCWLQGEDKMPLLCKSCLESLKKHSGDHPVVFITETNFSDYCYIPSYIIEKYRTGVIRPAHFADIIRTCLLYEHGGLWIDSTIFVTRNLPEEIFKSQYFSIKYPNTGYYITECKWSNFFLAAKPKSEWYAFVRNCFFLYLKYNNLFVDYFMMDYIMKWAYENNLKIKKDVDSIPYNNNNILSLSQNLSAVIDERSRQIIDGETYLFKLSWRITPIEEIDGAKTVWAYLNSYNSLI